MAKEYKPGFIYIKSTALNQEVAFSKKTGWVYCEDGVKYSPAELELMYKAGVEIDAASHNVKKVMGGEVIKIERPAGEGKQNEGTGGNDQLNNPDTHDKVPPPVGNGAGNEGGELDIF